jgi:hypothetical protein
MMGIRSLYGILEQMMLYIAELIAVFEVLAVLKVEVFLDSYRNCVSQ